MYELLAQQADRFLTPVSKDTHPSTNLAPLLNAQPLCRIQNRIVPHPDMVANGQCPLVHDGSRTAHACVLSEGPGSKIIVAVHHEWLVKPGYHTCHHRHRPPKGRSVQTFQHAHRQLRDPCNRQRSPQNDHLTAAKPLPMDLPPAPGCPSPVAHSHCDSGCAARTPSRTDRGWPIQKETVSSVP